jgi:hypothetical protein
MAALESHISVREKWKQHNESRTIVQHMFEAVVETLGSAGYLEKLQNDLNDILKRTDDEESVGSFGDQNSTRNPENTDLILGLTFQDFYEIRSLKKEMLYRCFFYRGFMVAIFGTLLTALSVQYHQSIVAWSWLSITGCFFRSLGVCLLVVVPVDEFDPVQKLVDEYHYMSRFITSSISIIMALIVAYICYHREHFEIIATILALIPAGFLALLLAPKVSYMQFAFTYSVGFAFIAATNVVIGLGSYKTNHFYYNYQIAVLYGVTAILLLCFSVYDVYDRKYEYDGRTVDTETPGENKMEHKHKGWGTFAIYRCMYLLSGVVGIANIFRGAQILESNDSSSSGSKGLLSVFVGISSLIPLILLLVIGYDKFFSLLARIFEYDMETLVNDGARMAYLLQASQHISSDAVDCFSTEKTHRVVSIDTLKKWAVDHEKYVSLGKIAEKRSKKDNRKHKFEEKEDKLHVFPLSPREEGALSPDIVEMQIKADNFKSAGLLGGRKIDYFVSHAWDDKCDNCRIAKYDALKYISERFQGNYFREPSLWIDKYCLDVRNEGNEEYKISLNLSILPINIARCNKMLILFSKNYMRRLWCVWELFTLFTFCSKETMASERIEILSIDGTVDEVISEIKTFQLENSHCFDPKEEQRIRSIIHLIGPDRLTVCFNVLAESIENRKINLSCFRRIVPRPQFKSQGVCNCPTKKSLSAGSQNDSNISSIDL